MTDLLINGLTYNGVNSISAQDSSGNNILFPNTQDANAAAADMLMGKTAYVQGEKVTGNIPSLSAATITPTTSEQIITAGQYLAGAQTIKGDANLIPENIKSGVSLFGVAGEMVAGRQIVTGSFTPTSTNVYINTNSPSGATGFIAVETGFVPSLVVMWLASAVNTYPSTSSSYVYTIAAMYNNIQTSYQLATVINASTKKFGIGNYYAKAFANANLNANGFCVGTSGSSNYQVFTSAYNYVAIE